MTLALQSSHAVLHYGGTLMTEENHTIRLLTEMREEGRAERADLAHRLDEAKDERAELAQRLDQAKDEREGLRQRVTEGEIRTSTELLSVSGSLDEIKALIRQQAAIKMVVTDHERRMRKLEGE